MRNGNYEHRSVETVVQQLPAARAYLREARIASTSRMRLHEACAATSVNSDELLAQIEARMRRQLRRATAEAETPHAELLAV